MVCASLGPSVELNPLRLPRVLALHFVPLRFHLPSVKDPNLYMTGCSFWSGTDLHSPPFHCFLRWSSLQYHARVQTTATLLYYPDLKIWREFEILPSVFLLSVCLNQNLLCLPLLSILFACMGTTGPWTHSNFPSWMKIRGIAYEYIWNIPQVINILVLGIEARASNMLIMLYCWAAPKTTLSLFFFNHKVSTSLGILI